MLWHTFFDATKNIFNLKKNFMLRNSERRGFAAMDPEERRRIARRGGEASHGGRGSEGGRGWSSEGRGGYSERGGGSSGRSSGNSRRGFAAMDPEEQRRIARKGGEASHG